MSTTATFYQIDRWSLLKGLTVVLPVTKDHVPNTSWCHCY